MYRDLAPSGPTCSRHAAAVAVADCARCGRALCDPCLVYARAAPHCSTCARRARRRQTLALAATVLGGVALLAAAIVVLVVLTRPTGFDYGLEAPRVRLLAAKAQANRCDHAATLAYDEAILRAGDARGALADSDDFLARCGDWSRLRWVRYAADEQLAAHEDAVAEATLLIAHDPTDHDYPWWRGVAYEALGRVDEAIADYQQTMRLLPWADAIPFALARLLERQGRPCQARDPLLLFARYHLTNVADPGIATQRAQLAAQLGRLTSEGHCTSAAALDEPPDPDAQDPNQTDDAE